MRRASFVTKVMSALRRRLALPSFLRQRIWLFVLLGGALFALASWGERRAQYVIVLDGQVRARLAAQWAGQANRPPDPSEMRSLLQAYIREEVLVRAARARALQADDVIVRRRLAQKMDYLLDAETVAPDEPSEQQLREFFARHAERYGAPARISFRQIPFDPVEQGDREAERRALQRTLAARPDAWRELGEPSMLPRAWLQRDMTDVRRDFGAAFVAALQRLAQSQSDDWQGPIVSTYGEHFVQIEAYAPARAAAYDEVRARLRADWASADLARQKDAAYDALRRQYSVRIIGE